MTARPVAVGWLLIPHQASVDSVAQSRSPGQLMHLSSVPVDNRLIGQGGPAPLAVLDPVLHHFIDFLTPLQGMTIKNV
ncbi:MAG: hypothetical protein VKK04_17460 [Synechococcales bacterium]|nr:hypothetical protein [Synechococcales bacterium]